MAERSASYEALILRAKEVPSGARVVTLLSAENGLVEAFVFGGGKSKLRSLASPWHFGRAWVYREPAKDFTKLSDFDALREYHGIRGDLAAIGAASFASEFIIATSAMGGDWADAVGLATSFLEALDEAAVRGDHDAVGRGVSLFTIRVLELLGQLPDPGECSACAGTMRSDGVHWYSRRAGGFLCGHCAGSGSGGPDRHFREDLLEVPPGAFAWLEAAAGVSFGDAVRVGLGKEALAGLKAFALDLARKAVESPLRTLDSGFV
jgi:DNA repair protein RecO (recombination protein O)